MVHRVARSGFWEPGHVTIVVPGTVALPGVPGPLSATAGPVSATVTFASSAAGGAATSYTVFTTPGGMTTTGTVSPIVVTGLVAGSAYSFRVAATNAAGSSAASVATNTVTPTAATAITAAQIKAAVGIFPGFASNNVDTGDGVAFLATWENASHLNRPIKFVDAFLSGTVNTGSADTGIHTEAGVWSRWRQNFAGLFIDAKGWRSRPDVRVVLGIPIIVGARGSTPSYRNSRFNAIRTGQSTDPSNLVTYNHRPDFEALAAAMIAAGHENAILRINPEMDINDPGFTPWSFEGGVHVAGVAASRVVIDWMRGVTGAKFEIECGGNGPWDDINPATGTTWGECCYFGDAWTDIIGVDSYFNDNSLAERKTHWQYNLDLARAKGKKFAMSEWGMDGSKAAGSPSADSAAYIQAKYDFLSTLKATELSHCNYFMRHYNSNLDLYPLAKAKFISLFK